MIDDKIFIVTYWDDGEEPVVSAFDNKEAAQSCFDYFDTCHDGCCLDESYLYSTFSVY